jgi:hypothetical protein
MVSFTLRPVYLRERASHFLRQNVGWNTTSQRRSQNSMLLQGVGFWPSILQPELVVVVVVVVVNVVVVVPATVVAVVMTSL